MTNICLVISCPLIIFDVETTRCRINRCNTTRQKIVFKWLCRTYYIIHIRRIEIFFCYYCLSSWILFSKNDSNFDAFIFLNCISLNDLFSIFFFFSTHNTHNSRERFVFHRWRQLLLSLTKREQKCTPLPRDRIRALANNITVFPMSHVYHIIHYSLFAHEK